MKNESLNKQIAETLASLDGLQRAQSAPYLLTRLQTRLAKENRSTLWTKLGTVISQPLTAACGVLLFVGVNVIVLRSFDHNKTSTSSAANSVASRYDFAINISSIYDIENQEP